MNYCFGVDIGGTTVKIGLFQTDGELVDKWEIKTRTENGGEAILPDVAEALKKKMEEKGLDDSQMSGIGIGIPAPVDENGVVQKTANLGWGYKEVSREMEELTGMKVAAGNDANVAALGEMWLGAGKGNKNMIMVTLGTGVGGGVIVNGQPLIGANGAGGEIGHIHIEDNDTESCNCGNKGCLEQYTSATGIARLARRYLAEHREAVTVLRKENISAKTVFDAVKAGDAAAKEIAGQFGDYLGKGLAMVSSVVNPEIFVIGGGVSKAGEILLSYIEPYFRKYAFGNCKETRFALAKLGNDAGIYGAAALVLL